MTLQYSCFISYRNPRIGENLAQHRKIVTDFYKTLAGELAMHVEEPVYIDKQRLKPGFFFNESLAESLCRSACMVMLYTPTYFHLEHPYCAREFRAMEELESARLGQVNHPSMASTGLILPVVIRGRDWLPPYVSDKRTYHELATLNLLKKRITSHSRYQEAIRQTARYVRGVCAILRETPEVFGQCTKFKLPEEVEIEDWLEDVAQYKPEFPI